MLAATLTTTTAAATAGDGGRATLQSQTVIDCNRIEFRLVGRRSHIACETSNGQQRRAARVTAAAAASALKTAHKRT